MSGDALDVTEDAGTAQATRAALAAGDRIGKYRLDRVLGEGGMGVVWAAHDPDLDRAIAIKLLRYAQARAQLRQRLLREARAMAKLKHPNVLTVYEVGTVGDRDYIAMELVEGTTLDKWFQHATDDERWRAAIAAGRGLAAAHAAGVVHRDFKPHNVLRSRDGRVLVTDFGLARGLLREGDSAAVAEGAPEASGLEATLLPRTSQREVDPSGLTPNRANDSILDSPLTQTGAMIGTPAYMAPEQYRGAPPDPRTDQFAFCVTAWQALTGERPFKGTTLEELREAANAGVERIRARLPRAVRAVLARGLDPDAGKRWPSLEALLDELERAGQLPARHRRIAFAAFGLAVMAALLLVPVLRKDPAKTAEQQGCAAPEKVFAEAWSHALALEVSRTPGARPASVARVTGTFDQFRDRWVESYHEACRVPAAKLRRARLGCLEGIRDQVGAIAYLLRSGDPRVFDSFDGPGILPNLHACESASPLAPPPIPTDQPRRGKIQALLTQTLALRAVPDEQLAGRISGLDADAAAAGWPPLVAMVKISAGNELLRRGRVDHARSLFGEGLRALAGVNGERRDVRLEAMGRLGLLEASMSVLEKPGAPPPPQIDQPRTKAVLHPELAGLISAARTAAGTDDMMLGAVALLETRARLASAQWNRYREAYDLALERSAKARAHFDAIGDVRRSAHTLAHDAEIYLQRGDERALDDAMFAARQAADALERAQMPPAFAVEKIRSDIAFARRDYTEAHRRLDRFSAPRQENTLPLVTGRVLGGGRDVTVVAWRGDLVGDRSRLYTDASTVDGEIVQAAQDGTFSIHAEPGFAIMAEAKGLRSGPQLVGSGSPVLQLVPTTTLSGTVTGHNLFGVRAFARFDIGRSRFIVEVPVDRDETFDLAGLPPGTPHTGITGAVGHGTRHLVGGPGATKLAWPSGQAIEVIVRGDDRAPARVLVFRGRATITTLADLEAMAATSADVAQAPASPIGASATDAGREHYQPGDRHAVITGNAEGTVMACAATTKVACRAFELERSVEVTYPDGRFAAGVTPLVLEL